VTEGPAPLARATGREPAPAGDEPLPPARLARRRGAGRPCRLAAWLLASALLAAALLAGPAARPAPTDAAPTSQEANSWEGVLARAADLRGLAPKAPVPRTLVSREELQRRVVEQLSRGPVAERLATNTKLLTALGLLERGADLRGLLLQFRGGLVLGQYDPESKQLWVVTGDSVLGPLERVTAAHEFTHALQDQYFDLLRLRPSNAPNADRSLAISALLEADGGYIGERYAATALNAAEREERRRQIRDLYRDVNLGEIPLVVREQSYFPYVEGPRWLRQVLSAEALRGEGYGPAVDRLFQNPPESTAQILHPERYQRHQAPVTVALGDTSQVLGTSWHETRQGVLGELDHRLLVQHYLDASVAAKAAEGWAGSTYALFEDAAHEVAVLVRTRWDDAGEAGEWLEAYGNAVQARYGSSLELLDERPGRRLWHTRDGALLLGGEGAETVLALAPTRVQVERLAALQADPPLRGLDPRAATLTLGLLVAPGR